MKTIKDKQYSFNHVKKRLKERYNLDITMNEYANLCLSRVDHIPINVEYQKNDTQKIYDMYHKGFMVRVVYSEKRNLITTVLPKEKENV